MQHVQPAGWQNTLAEVEQAVGGCLAALDRYEKAFDGVLRSVGTPAVAPTTAEASGEQLSGWEERLGFARRHADAVEVLEASPDRVDSLCPVAGADGAGCCDLAFAEPAAARRIKGQVVANQLARLGDFPWEGVAEPVGAGSSLGWRTRLQLDVGIDGRAGLHRYHSSELVTDLR